jgi:hypothetical protein
LATSTRQVLAVALEPQRHVEAAARGAGRQLLDLVDMLGAELETSAAPDVALRLRGAADRRERVPAQGHAA